MSEEYWQKRCEFWCARYLELAQAVSPLLVTAGNVDDYSELQHHVKTVKAKLRGDAYGIANNQSADSFS
jgi:hypothetical protein